MIINLNLFYFILFIDLVSITNLSNIYLISLLASATSKNFEKKTSFQICFLNPFFVITINITKYVTIQFINRTFDIVLYYKLFFIIIF